jgi:hypothetical protein
MRRGTYFEGEGGEVVPEVRFEESVWIGSVELGEEGVEEGISEVVLGLEPLDFLL